MLFECCHLYGTYRSCRSFEFLFMLEKITIINFLPIAPLPKVRPLALWYLHGVTLVVPLVAPGDREVGPLVHRRHPVVHQLMLLMTVLVAEVHPVFAAHGFVAIKKTNRETPSISWLINTYMNTHTCKEGTQAHSYAHARTFALFLTHKYGHIWTNNINNNNGHIHLYRYT